MLAAATTTLFAYVVRQQASALTSKDAELAALRQQCQADVAWYRTQLDSWTAIGRRQVSGLEKLASAQSTEAPR